MKIFVTVGTHSQSFDALLNSLLPWIQKGEHEWTIQSGSSQIEIPEVRQESFFSPDEISELIQRADLVISHLGCGIAREVQEAGTPALFMCRRQHRAEHVDDHQLELQEALTGRAGIRFFEPGEDPEEFSQKISLEKPESPHHLKELVGAIKNWLD